jgi:hypothetical protein
MLHAPTSDSPLRFKGAGESIVAGSRGDHAAPLIGRAHPRRAEEGAVQSSGDAGGVRGIDRTGEVGAAERDGSVTAEVARRQGDGTWLWVIDQFSIA